MTPNPILVREVKERMRSLRAPVVLTIYLLILGMIVFATERLESRGFAGPLQSAVIGRTVFHWLLFFLLVVVCFLVPAFTAGTVSAERERQTLPLLQVTLMKPRSIILGKLGSSMAYLFLLLIATIPLVSVSFILGGVTPLDVVRGYAMVVLTGFTIGVIGIALSANMRRTMSATVLTFALVATLTVGTALGYALIRVYVERDINAEPRFRQPVWTLVLNPFIGTASAIQGRNRGGLGSTPFEGLFSFLSSSNEVVAFAENTVGVPQPISLPAGGPDRAVVLQKLQAARAQAVRAHGTPVWVSTVGWYLGLSGVGYLLAVAGVRSPARGIRVGRRRIAIGDT